MIWQRHGEVGMISPPFRVGKFFLDGCTLYGLWFNDEHLGYFNSFEECQEEAEKHKKDNAELRGASRLHGEASLANDVLGAKRPG